MISDLSSYSSPNPQSPIPNPSSFTFRSYQREDIARAAMHDGAIIAWDPGLGKTMAMFTWPMVKQARRVIIVAPAALHEQITDEGRTKFGVTVRPLPDQATALDYMRRGILPYPSDPSSPENLKLNTENSLPQFFITAYNWLGYNGADEWAADEPNELLRLRRLVMARQFVGIADQATADAVTSSGYQPRAKQTAWEILKVAPGSAPNAIKSAWFTIAKLYHPDLHPGDPKAESTFKLANAAYRKLTGLDEQEFDRQMAALATDPQIAATKLTLEACELGIGSERNGIRCVFRPTLASIVKTTFDCVVCDEAVKIKSGTAFNAEGVLRLEARYHLALTGTPIKNKLPDLFFLASFVTGHHARATARWPYGNGTEDRAQFANDFGVFEENLTKRQQELKKGGSRRTFGKTTARICNIHRLWRILGPVVLRRRKDDVPGTDIVGKTMVPVRVMPGTHQQHTYRFHLDNPPPYESDLAALGAQLQCLRMAALHPASASLSRLGCPAARSGYDFTPKSAGIIQLAIDLMEKGEQLVVFSPFTEFSDSLSERFTTAGVPHLKLDGQMAPTKRGKLVKRFKSGEYPILIAGIASMGEGHSLDNAHHLVLPSLDWAYDQNSQAVERVHRLTSKKDVTIYVMVTKGTIDERLTSSWQEKGDASDLALDGRLVEDERQEIDLAQLLRDATADFDPNSPTMNEAEVEDRWKTILCPSLHRSFTTYRTLRPITPSGFQTPPHRPSHPSTPSTKSSSSPIQKSTIINHQSEIPASPNPQSSIPHPPLSLFALMKQHRQSAQPTPASTTDHSSSPSPIQKSTIINHQSEIPSSTDHRSPITLPKSPPVQPLRNIIPFPGRLGATAPTTAKPPVVIPACLQKA